MDKIAELEKQIIEEMNERTQVYVAEQQKTCIIDNDLRTIQIPSELEILGTESDDDVNRIKFKMPKMYGQIDLSNFEVRINYKNGNVGDVYVVQDKVVELDTITFSWLVGRNAVKTKGYTQFIVCLRRKDELGNVMQEFNTTVARLNVLEGLETTEQVVQEYPDVIEQILTKIEGLTEITPEQIEQAIGEYLQKNPFPNTLPNPHPLTFTGAVTGSYDGSEPVEVNIPEGSSGNMEQEWKLFQTIEGNAETVEYKWDNVDFEELLFIGLGLKNINETIDSGVIIRINGLDVASLQTDKASETIDGKYQKVYMKYNGFFWEVYKTSMATNETGYYDRFTNLQQPYSTKLGLGKCNKLMLGTTYAYMLKSGTIKIYGR